MLCLVGDVELNQLLPQSCKEQYARNGSAAMGLLQHISLEEFIKVGRPFGNRPKEAPR